MPRASLMHSDARTLIAVRVVVVTTLLLASLIIQFTVRELLPINYIYLTAGFAYALTLVYIGVAQLIVALPQQTLQPMAIWTSSRVYFNIATNLAGFYATALLTSYISEKLQKTSEELDANRQNLAELRALNQNVVESIPSGLVTLSNY